MLLLIFVYRKKTGQEGFISLLDKDLVRFEYQPTTQTILLFRANQKKVHTTLFLISIIRCEVSLNNNVINTIDGQPENAISNQNEVDIRALFIKEHSNKMDDVQSRRIEIVLSDKDDSYTVCLYLRKGSNRVTGSKYYEVIDMLIDLCWVISRGISPQVTETRLIPVIAKVTVFDEPTAIWQPRKDDHVNDSAKSETTSEKLETILQPDTSNGKTIMAQAAHQTKMIDALEKLAGLHQQGHLTDEEFTLAKTKLLQNMLDN